MIAWVSITSCVALQYDAVNAPIYWNTEEQKEDPEHWFASLEQKAESRCDNKENNTQCRASSNIMSQDRLTSWAVPFTAKGEAPRSPPTLRAPAVWAFLVSGFA